MVTAFSLVPGHHSHHLRYMTYLLPSNNIGRSSKKRSQDPECLPLTLRTLHRLSRCTAGITRGPYTVQVYRRYHLRTIH